MRKPHFRQSKQKRSNQHPHGQNREPDIFLFEQKDDAGDAKNKHCNLINRNRKIDHCIQMIDHPETFDCKITDCCDGACQFCFPEGTSIQTSMGLKNIENIQIDDKVYSMNKSGDIQIKNVDQIFKRKYKGDLIKISDGKNTITCTPNHEICTKNRGWVRADELMESDELLTFKH